MRLSLSGTLITLLGTYKFSSSDAFSVGKHANLSTSRSHAAAVYMTATDSSTDTNAPESSATGPVKKLSILTFDLDDTLYPLSTVLDEANSAFARSMNQFGYDDIQPQDIVKTGKRIRDAMSETDPAKAASLSHTEIRRLAIREEMEKIEYQRKLQSCADDWATQVSSLSPLVVQNAKK